MQKSSFDKAFFYQAKDEVGFVLFEFRSNRNATLQTKLLSFKICAQKILFTP
jgi:hypothetical protein